MPPTPKHGGVAVGASLQHPKGFRDPIADTLWDVGVPLLAPPKTMGRVLITPRDMGIPLLPPYPNTPSMGGASGMTPLS